MNRITRMLAAGIATAALAAMLGGCGGSSGSSSTESSASNTPTQTGGGTDSFLAEVSRVLGMTSDTSEPAAVDQTAPTAPENTEPAPVS